MSVFKSKLEEIQEAVELNFSASPGFGDYKQFLSHAIAHPAKMNTKLLKFLIENFTQEDDTILDPMSGSGSTGVVAALLNRNAVQVDIEKKFVDWAEEAKRKVEAQATLTPKGTIRNILGDTRKLSELLKEADVVITSPPYGEAQDGHGIAKEGYRGKKHSPTDLVGNRSYMPDKFESEENISKLKYDAVITSPPYASVLNTKKENKFWKEMEKKHHRTYRGTQALAKEDYGNNKENIGNLPFDAVITSPPYEGSLEDRKGGGILTREGARPDSEATATRNLLPCKYSSSKDNIGNLKKETYLEAMLKVYSEMYKVLKPNGLCIIIIKPFIRNKKCVDLPLHTWLLLEKVGFKLIKLFKLMLLQESFWRILYHKKYKDVPKIAHEYILITQKTWRKIEPCKEAKT